MKGKFSGLSQCSSQQNFSLPYYYPLSPLSKVSTPHRPRPNHTTSYASPIAFLTAANHDRSPSGKENQAVSLNQSPMTNTFNPKMGDRNDHGKRPISNMSKNLSGRPSYHPYHKSDQNSEGIQGQYTNFQQTLRSITQKSPQGQPKTKLKMSFSNNFQGILEAQDYQIKQKGLQTRKTQEPFSKKASFQNQQWDERLFSSCLQNSEKRGLPLQPQRKEQLLCMNEDGNIAKYITIASEDDDQRLYYCSKCTVLLVNQGFVLEEIKKSKAQQPLDGEDVSGKIEACRDKLSSLINDLSMRESFEVAKIAQFYDGLTEVLEKCRKQGELYIKSLYEQKIEEYQSILQEVDLFGQNIKETQQNLAQFEGLHQQILHFSLGGPFLNKYDTPQLNKLQQAFSNVMQEQFTLTSHLKSISKVSDSHQTLVNRNHGLRFSFEKLLHDISSKKSRMQDIISSLAEEEQSEGLEVCSQSQKTAFRDLFPEENCQINSSVNSPTFKHI